MVNGQHLYLNCAFVFILCRSEVLFFFFYHRVPPYQQPSEATALPPEPLPLDSKCMPSFLLCLFFPRHIILTAPFSSDEHPWGAPGSKSHTQAYVLYPAGASGLVLTHHLCSDIFEITEPSRQVGDRFLHFSVVHASKCQIRADCDLRHLQSQPHFC